MKLENIAHNIYSFFTLVFGGIKFMEQFLTQHKMWIDVTVAIGAIVFGFWQILINRRLKSIQDYVSVAAVPEPTENKVRLLNTGKQKKPKLMTKRQLK